MIVLLVIILLMALPLVYNKKQYLLFLGMTVDCVLFVSAVFSHTFLRLPLRIF